MIGNDVRKRRLEAGLSASSVAKQLHVTRSAVSFIELSGKISSVTAQRYLAAIRAAAAARDRRSAIERTVRQEVARRLSQL